MTEEIQLYLDEAKSDMDKALTHTAVEFTKIRAGKASPAMLDGIMVSYYDALTPLAQVASVSALDARTLSIKPWEKSLIQAIEKAIQDSDLGITPQNNGESILLNIPMLTEERRRDLVKQAKNEAENGKIRIRNIRKTTNDGLKSLQKEGASEDAVKSAEEEVQKLTNSYISKVDEMLAKKDTEIMTV